GFYQAEESRRQRQVDVFGESLDDAEDLRQRGASLEDDGVTEGGAEEQAEQPADPDVLLDDDGREAEAGRGFVDVEPALVGRQPQECERHGCESSRRWRCIHAGARAMSFSSAWRSSAGR